VPRAKKYPPDVILKKTTIECPIEVLNEAKKFAIDLEMTFSEYVTSAVLHYGNKRPWIDEATDNSFSLEEQRKRRTTWTK
jgi:hypothetical protein